MKSKIEKIFQDKNIRNISFDSRFVKEGDCFFAIKGQNFDGNKYIESVLKSGASVVVTDNANIANHYGDKVVLVENARIALSLAAGILYPTLPKNLIGVTGTNGKSSVVSYIYQILNLLGRSCTSIGTIGIESNAKFSFSSSELSSGLTTPDPLTFRRNLHILAENGVESVAFEASSHGIDQDRLGDIKLKSAAFVSFSQDHLDYHGSMENYLAAKLKLFLKLENSAEAIINSEIMRFDEIENFLKEKKIPYSTVGANGDLRIINCKTSKIGQEIYFEFRGKEYKFKTNIIGSFQAINILIAAKIVCNLGVNFDEIVKILPKLNSVSGRLQRVGEIDDIYQIFVDYAHTPDALEKSLIELRDIKGSSGLLYVIFGCGGDRDASKRPIMGKIASDLADYVVVTDDNPRYEDPGKIRKDIISSISSEYIEIAERKQAIIDVIAQLKKDDILLIAGKGHENYQVIKGNVIELSDLEIASSALKTQKGKE